MNKNLTFAIILTVILIITIGGTGVYKKVKDVSISGFATKDPNIEDEQTTTQEETTKTYYPEPVLKLTKEELQTKVEEVEKNTEPLKDPIKIIKTFKFEKNVEEPIIKVLATEYLKEEA
jgi:peptidoglycan hydrolase CwlO-like protein